MSEVFRHGLRLLLLISLFVNRSWRLGPRILCPVTDARLVAHSALDGAVGARSSRPVQQLLLLNLLADGDVAEDVKELALASVVVLAAKRAKIILLLTLIRMSVESGLTLLKVRC